MGAFTSPKGGFVPPTRLVAGSGSGSDPSVFVAQGGYAVDAIPSDGTEQTIAAMLFDGSDRPLIADGKSAFCTATVFVSAAEVADGDAGLLQFYGNPGGAEFEDAAWDFVSDAAGHLQWRTVKTYSWVFDGDGTSKTVEAKMIASCAAPSFAVLHIYRVHLRVEILPTASVSGLAP